MAARRRKPPADESPSKAKSAKKTVGKSKRPPTKTASRELASGLVTILRKGKKKNQQERVQLLSDGPALSKVTEWIPTCFPAADAILGGGLAIGRISEIFGPEGSGKSAFTHMSSKGCQSIGGTVVFLDFEAALDPEKVEQLGIDPTRLVYSVPETAEEGCDQLKDLVAALQAVVADPKKTSAPTLIVWDSVAAAPTKEEKEKDADQTVMPHKAKMMGRVSRELMLELQKARAHLMFVNQEREAIGKPGMFVEPVVPGGKGIKYAASQRLRVQRVKTNKRSHKGQQIATSYTVKLSTKKCRLTPPHQKVELILDFEYGLSPEMTMLHHLLATGDAKKAKGIVTVPWRKASFPESMWMEMMHDTDSDFRAEAEAYYERVARESNWLNAKVDTVSIEDEEEPEDTPDESGEDDEEEEPVVD